MCMASFLVPFFQVYRVKRFDFQDLFVKLSPFSKYSYIVTACLSAVSMFYMMIYSGILMREDIFVFGLSSHDLAIEVSLCLTLCVFYVGASMFFPAFYSGKKMLTIASGCLCSICSFVLLLFACFSRENIQVFQTISAGEFDANLTPENEQVMLAVHQMCCFIVFGHTTLMHALLWNIVYNKRTKAKDLLTVPRPGSSKVSRVTSRPVPPQ